MAKEEDKPKIDPEKQAEMELKARRVIAQTLFLRWTSNFPKDTLFKHPESQEIIMLPPMLSSKFSFAIQSTSLFLGVQAFEAPWMLSLPWECAYASDALYLKINKMEVMNVKLPAYVLGLFVETSEKLSQMQHAKHLQFIQTEVSEGKVVSYGKATGLGIPVYSESIVNALREEKQRAQKALNIQSMI